MKYPDNHIASTAKVIDSIILPPCLIGDGVVIEGSVVGPHVAVGDHATIRNTRVRNSIVRDHAQLRDAGIDNSLIGSHAHVKGRLQELSLGDYSTHA
jgi:glucose-1-phosphate thymidylyltransferase